MVEKVSTPFPAAPANPKAGLSTFMTIFIFGLALIVLLDNQLRESLGTAIGYAFDPLFGFNYQFPITTLLITGMMMTTLTIVIRHFFTNYVAQAEGQKIVGAFNKELRQARKDNNGFKLKKLLEMQPKIVQAPAHQHVDHHPHLRMVGGVREQHRVPVLFRALVEHGRPEPGLSVPGMDIGLHLGHHTVGPDIGAWTEILLVQETPERNGGAG
jgi:hypothetical protein